MSSNKLHNSVLTTARRTEPGDAKKIIDFINRHTLELFGPNCREIGKIYELM